MPARKLESEGSPNDACPSEEGLQEHERNGHHTSLVAFVTGATGISSVHLIQVRPDLHCLHMLGSLQLYSWIVCCARYACSCSHLQRVLAIAMGN